MRTAAPAPDPLEDAADADGWERALLDDQLAGLKRLADMGLAIAGAIEARVLAAGPEPDAALQHAALDFSRVARAVRQTYALQSRLVADYKGKPGKAVAAASPVERYEVVWGEPTLTSEQIANLKFKVRHAAGAAGYEGDAVERLVLEAVERLEDDDIDRDLSKLPFSEIIARICRDLGLEPQALDTSRPLDGVRAAPIGAWPPPSVAADPGQPAPHAASP